MSRYIDFKLIEEVPNKYNLTPQSIANLKVLDFEKLKKKCCWIPAANAWIHREGVGMDLWSYDYINEFYYKIQSNGFIEFKLMCDGGMCWYNPSEFYKSNCIENKWDMEIQAKALRWVNGLIDEGILGV